MGEELKTKMGGNKEKITISFGKTKHVRASVSVSTIP